MAEKILEQLINEYVQKGVAKSLILTCLDRLERGLPLDDPKGFPRTSSGRILSLNKAGCERELDILENHEINLNGQVVKRARKTHATIMKDQAWANWERHRSAQPHLPEDTPPTRQFAHEIARREAAIRVCQLEAEALRKRLAELEKVEEQERQQQIERLRWKGIGKLKGGVLVQMDGRAVVQNEKGEDVFEDDPSNTIAAYREEIKQRKLEQRKKQQATATAV